MLYQLKNFWFDYGVVLNIATDHLDRHKDFEDYAQSKLNILKYTKKSAFTNPELYSQLSEKLKSHVQVYQPVHTLE
jgi:UDP-N-acetylmuramoylalanine-D-glutamate ligase